MSTGELTVIPEVIYLTKEKLKRRLKRSPTDQELATALKMSPSSLSKLKRVKVKYSETSLTPSLAASRGAVAYRHAKHRSKKQQDRFANGTQYDSDGGAKRKRRHSRRSRNKTKRSKQN
jgi:hypothetical protein